MGDTTGVEAGKPAARAAESGTGGSPEEQVSSLFAERTRTMTWSARNRSAPRPGTIVFGGGMPDPVRYPIGAFSELLPDVLREPGGRPFTYATGSSSPVLGEALAEHHAQLDGVDIAPTQIVATYGTAGGIGVATQVFVEPGDVVITEDLTYWGAVATFRLAGAEIVTVPLEDGVLSVPALAELLPRLAAEGKRVKLLYTIAAAQSPTGMVLDRAKREAVAELARRHGVVILQDDTYGEIRYELEAFPASMIGMAPERTIHLGSFSKTIAPGLRLGWMATSPDIAAACTAIRTDLGTNPIIQHLVGGYIASGQYDQHVASGRPFYQHKRDTMVASLEEHCAPYCTWLVPPGGYYMWLQLRSGDVGTVEQFAEAEGVAFMPGPQFSPTRVATEGFRVAYGEVGVDDIVEGVRRLGRALAQADASVGAGR